MKNDFNKQLPFSLEAEQAVLGSVLIDPENFKEVASFLSIDDFYIEEHRNIFAAMRTLSFDMNVTIDVVTLINALVESGTYDESSGKEYIKKICEMVPTSANLIDYANIVKDKSVLRQLIAAADKISDAAYSEQESAEDILDLAEQEIYGISEQNEHKGFVSINELVTRTYNQISEISRNPELLTGLQTNYSKLDSILVGLNKGDLVFVGARPGVGKTSFCLNIAQNAAYYGKKTVCIFSLEMSGEQLVTRMLSTEACIPSTSLRSGKLTDEDWMRLGRAASKLSECKIYIDDTAETSISMMKAKLRRLKSVGLVVIDYLQLMHGEKKTDNRVQEVSEISRRLKLMAKDLEVPIICCSQLNRAVEGRKDKIPTLADLRESGSIEQDADIVIMLYRPDASEQNQNQQNRAQIIVAKNRHGSTGVIDMAWEGQFTKFTELTDINAP